MTDVAIAKTILQILICRSEEWDKQHERIPLAADGGLDNASYNRLIWDQGVSKKEIARLLRLYRIDDAGQVKCETASIWRHVARLAKKEGYKYHTGINHPSHLDYSLPHVPASESVAVERVKNGE